MASVMSRGKSRCIPVVAKYGEHPMHWWTVMQLAHNTDVATKCHLDWLPSQALNNACQILKCACSAMPLV